MLSTLVQELSKEWELDSPLPQEIPGVYTVPLDPGVMFTITSGPSGGVILSSSIAEIPKGCEEELFTEALLADLFGQGTRGALLGLNDNGTILTLSHLIDYDPSFKEFRDHVEDFINTIDFWREKVMMYRS